MDNKKEIWELTKEELLDKLHEGVTELLCTNKSDYDFWVIFLKGKLPQLEIRKSCGFPCKLQINTTGWLDNEMFYLRYKRFSSQKDIVYTSEKYKQRTYPADRKTTL